MTTMTTAWGSPMPATNTRIPAPGEANWLSEARIPVHEVLCVSGPSALCTLRKTDGTISKPTSQYWDRWLYVEPKPAPRYRVEWRLPAEGELVLGIDAVGGVLGAVGSKFVRTERWVIVPETDGTPQVGETWHGSVKAYEFLVLAKAETTYGVQAYLCQHLTDDRYVFALTNFNGMTRVDKFPTSTVELRTAKPGDKILSLVTTTVRYAPLSQPYSQTVHPVLVN